MCNCKGTSFEKTQIVPPFQDKFVTIDTCILEELKALWEKGIVTTASGCGHNIFEGYIAVEPEYIPTMLWLGYTGRYIADKEFVFTPASA